MSMATINMNERKYERIIDINIHHMLDETYIHLNHIKMIVSILLYIFSLRIVEGRILSPEVLSLKNKIIKLIGKCDILINDFDEIKMIVDYSNFICGNYQGIYHFIDEIYKIYNPTGQIIESKVKYILYKMIRIFIYDRDLLYPFTNHNEAKNDYLIKYNYVHKTHIFKRNYSVFSHFKKKFINKFFYLFNSLDKLIDNFKLDAIFEFKYTFLYKLTDIAVKRIFTNDKYKNDNPAFDYTGLSIDGRTLFNINSSYNKYYVIIIKYIRNIKDMNMTLQTKLISFNTELNSMDITTESIDKIAQVVDKLDELIGKLFELSKEINIRFYNHIKIILKKSTLTLDTINNKFKDDFNKYDETIKQLEDEFIIYNL
jgi:hypothetical protein